MKIVINTSPLLSPLTGVGNYIYNIAKALKIIDPINDFTYFYGFYSRNLFSYETTRTFFQIKEFINKIPLGKNILRTTRNLLNRFSIYNFDLYFEPNFIPINIKSRSVVVTIFDFSFLLFPEWHPRERIRYFKENFWKNLERAERIIVISDFIKKSGVSLGIPEAKLRTVHLGLDREVFKICSPGSIRSLRLRYSLPEHFIFFSGSLEPRKNLINLIEAYSALDKGIKKDIKLVLAGFKGWQNKEIMALLKKAKSDVLYLGYIPNAVLRDLYNLATLFVYPSFYEGFGLPPLEAMACGCPVVVSNVASLPEVCGDATQYVDPHDVNSIAEGITKVLSDETLRRNLIVKGLERAKLFSWEQAAKKHIEVFEDAAENCHHS